VPFEEQYRRQVALLLRTIPLIGAEDCFALKGGTAINLFIRDMPRLSVDIDLTYLPVQPRDRSLKAIDAAMTRVSERIVKAIPGARVTPSKAEGAILKLLYQPSESVTLVGFRLGSSCDSLLSLETRRSSWLWRSLV
jgi:hypothetical protein